jgi:arginine decarboxylase
VPDPAAGRVRVFSTQSTHKTLTSLRQGSMIHVWDQDFSQKVEDTFHEAYMTHTSTSPNYQILASLDLGRRQAALEGFELVLRQIENAMRLRDAVEHHPLLSRYMRCLTTTDLIPAGYRPTGIEQPLRSGLATMIRAWESDEFVLDPSRITIYIGATGIEGDTFKRSQLMDRYGVQINKTSRNTVLFMTTIGTNRSSVAYLIEVLVAIARDLEVKVAGMSPAERAAHEREVLRLTAPSAPLPDFSGFHLGFKDSSGQPTPEGDVRRAFYLAYNESYCEYLKPEEIEQRVESGEQVGVHHLRHALPAGLPGACARPGVQPGDPGLHAQPGHARGARLPARPRLPRLHRQSPRDRRDAPAGAAVGCGRVGGCPSDRYLSGSALSMANGPRPEPSLAWPPGHPQPAARSRAPPRPGPHGRGGRHHPELLCRWP